MILVTFFRNLYGYDDSGARVSLAWFRRNEFRLHPSTTASRAPFTRPMAATPSKLTLPPLHSIPVNNELEAVHDIFIEGLFLRDYSSI